MEINLDPLADPDEIVAVAEKLAVKTASWRPGQAGALARENWAEIADPDVAEFGRLLNEVFARGSAGKMSASAQDRSIALYERLRTALPEARAFFDRQVEHVNKMRARARTRERDARRRQEIASAKVQRFEILAHPDDINEIRELAQAKLEARGVKMPEPKRRGRPRKDTVTGPTPPAKPNEPAAESAAQRFYAAQKTGLGMFMSDPPRKK